MAASAWLFASSALSASILALISFFLCSAFAASSFAFAACAAPEAPRPATPAVRPAKTSLQSRPQFKEGTNSVSTRRKTDGKQRERERVRSGVTYLLETAPLGRFACAMAMVLARTAEVLRAAALAAPGGILIPLLCSAKLVKRSKRRHPHPWKRGSLCCCACVCVSEFS